MWNVECGMCPVEEGGRGMGMGMSMSMSMHLLDEDSTLREERAGA